MLFTKARSVALHALDYEIWVILALTGLGFLSTQFLPIAGLAGLLFGGIRWVGKGKISVRTPPDGAVLVLILMLPVTLWATGDLSTTQIQVFRLLNGIVLYYSLINWANNPSRLQWMILGLLGVGVLLALYAAISVEWDPSKIPFFPVVLYERFVLLVGDTVHRNVMAGALVLILPLSISLIVFAPQQPSKLLYAVILLGGLGVLVMLLLTQSRGALIAFFLAACLLLTLRWKWLRWVGIGLTFVGVIFLMGYGVQNTLIRLTSGGSLDELAGRFETWHRAGYMIQDFSFTGIGMGTFSDTAEKLYPFILQEPGSVPHAHNLFLQVAVDLGIPGFVAWLAILISATKTAWKLYLKGNAHRDTRLTGIGAGLFSSQIALMIHGLFDAVTWGMVRPAPLVWAIWGLVFAFSQGYRLSESDRPSGV